MPRLLLLSFLMAVLGPAQPLQPLGVPPNTERASASLPHFEGIGPQAGLGVSHVSSREKRYIIESVSGGIGRIDCDNDGKLDIVAVHGSNVDRYRKPGGDPLVTLYRQDANLGFRDIGSRIEPKRVGHGRGSCRFYRNKHDGTFEEVGLLEGSDLSGDGQEPGSMGVDFGDYLHTGRMGIFVTEFVDQSDTLYRNNGSDGFSDVSSLAGIAQPSHPYVRWGTAVFDMDNDGWLDIFAANGYVYP